MAVIQNKVSNSLVLKEIISTENDKNKYKNQRIGKVKVSATSQDIYDVAMAISGLLKFQVDEILIQETDLLINA